MRSSHESRTCLFTFVVRDHRTVRGGRQLRPDAALLIIMNCRRALHTDGEKIYMLENTDSYITNKSYYCGCHQVATRRMSVVECPVLKTNCTTAKRLDVAREGFFLASSTRVLG